MQDTDSKTLPDLEVRGRWGTNGVGSGEFRLVAWGMGGGWGSNTVALVSHPTLRSDLIKVLGGKTYMWPCSWVWMWKVLGNAFRYQTYLLVDLLQKHGLRKTQPIAALLCVYFNCRSIGVCCSRIQHDIGDVPLTPQDFVNDYNFHWIHEWHRF